MRHRKLLTLASLALIFGAAEFVSADIINVPGDQPTIQAGIDAASDGDEVIVSPGAYFENINLLGKAIALRSANPSDAAVVEAIEVSTPLPPRI